MDTMAVPYGGSMFTLEYRQMVKIKLSHITVVEANSEGCLLIKQ